MKKNTSDSIGPEKVVMLKIQHNLMGITMALSLNDAKELIAYIEEAFAELEKEPVAAKVKTTKAKRPKRDKGTPR